MNPKWFVIINPAAAGGKSGEQWTEVSALLKKAAIDFEFHVTRSADEVGSAVADAIQKGYRNFCAVGGDGTLHLLVNAIFNQKEIPTSEFTIAIIPIGTGNDWIRTHLIPKKFTDCIEILKTGKTVFHDVAKVKIENAGETSERYFINMIGIGFDGFVAHNIELLAQTQKKSALVYIKGLLRSLFNYNAQRMSIESTDQKLAEEILSVSAGICRFCGGGMNMAPEANFNDGLFDVTIVKKIGKANVIANVAKLYNGKIGTHKRVVQWRTPYLKITSNPPLHVETDGEVLSKGNVELVILPRSVSVMTP